MCRRSACRWRTLRCDVVPRPDGLHPPHRAQGGDCFGRTVNLAARIAAYAGAGRVLVSEPVAERVPPQGVSFIELGQVQLEGIAHLLRLLEARQA